MNRICLITLMTIFAIFSCGCDKTQTPASISVEKIRVIENLDLPECFVIDPASGDLYISNIVTPNEGYWEDDNNGFISKMAPDGTMIKLRWLESTPDMPINAPKGMCIFKGRLYFTDNTKLKSCRLDDPSKVEIIEIKDAENLNDLAADAESIWVTDTAKGKIFRIVPDENITEIPAPESVNGVTTYNGKAFAVSWDLHEIYELDPTGKNQPVPFGLAENFVTLDCIEVMPDGTFIISDYNGNMLYSISPDRKTVTKLIELQSPADFALDRKNNLIYVPEMLVNRAVILKLK